MSWLHQIQNKVANFIAPKDMPADVNEVLFPLCDVQTPDAAATIAVTIKQMVTFVHLATDMVADATLNLTIDAQVTKGAILHVLAKSDTTARALTPGTGFTAPAIAGVISKTKVQSFIYNGSKFFPMGAALQID